MNWSPELMESLTRSLFDTLTLVLAGGRGTRLKHLTENETKPALPFGGKFRIIDFTLSNCVNSGIRRIAVLTQYKAHHLIQHVQGGWGFLRRETNEFIELWPAQQQTLASSWYSGTADAVHQNLELIKGHGGSYILILAGDHIYKQDYSRLIAHHIESGADVTISCVDVPRDLAHEYGVVEVDSEGTILQFLEKPKAPPSIPGRPDRSLASMGIYVFNADLLYEQLEQDAALETSSHDFGRDVIPRMVPEYRAVCHNFDNSCVTAMSGKAPYWRDVGTVDAYWAANMDLTHIDPPLDLYDPDWPIWTLQEQQPGAKFVFDYEGRRGMAIDSVVSSGCIISGGTVCRSLLFHKVRINSFSLVEDSLVLPGSDIGRHCRIRRAIIGSGCDIPEGMVVGEDREEDESRFYVTGGGVTLVTETMLR